MARVMFVSPEPVGDRMAGPSIRPFELARVAAREHEVTLVAPGPSTLSEPGIELLESEMSEHDRLLAAAAKHDVVVAERLPMALLRDLMRLDTRYVVDLNNPGLVETIEAVADREPRAQRRVLSIVRGLTVANCAAADFMVSGSERTRDLWLGVLSGHGLIDLDSYRHDATARALIDVVPFGLPDEPPARGGPALKGVRDGIDSGDRVLVWHGGIWNWLDAETAIRATGLLADMEPAVHLFFPGVKRPVADSTNRMNASERALALARELGLEGERVHFNSDWVPYAQRADYLLDADLGLSAHRDHLEARFSFRTRLLDYFWAALPVVCTRGDTLAETVAEAGAGRVTDFDDAEGFAAACRELLEDDAQRDACGEAARRLAPEYRWSHVAEPLLEYLRDPGGRPRPRKRRDFVTRTALGLYPSLLAQELADLGPAAVGRRLARNARRALSLR